MKFFNTKFVMLETFAHVTDLLRSSTALDYEFEHYWAGLVTMEVH